ncbi:hypothetical protein [uncultured Brevibacillus sp.]|uniref:hypothetical protein n=1 Tax=uncultured Brevibacillus sp. TaxID=169970 RepID=UPI0025950A07|nr:hypothetical protein [uncultured Brevibacillus sp.]
MKLRKIGVTMLAAVMLVLVFSATSFARIKEDNDFFTSSLFHPDYGLYNLSYDVFIIEDYYVDRRADDVELSHHHAVGIGKTGGYPFKMEIQLANVYKDSNGTIGSVSNLNWNWKDRLDDYFMDKGNTAYGGGSKKVFYSTVSEKPKLTTTSQAVADGIIYGTSGKITMSLY